MFNEEYNKLYYKDKIVELNKRTERNRNKNIYQCIS